MTRLIIAETGQAADDLVDRYGRYSKMMTDMLAEVGGDFRSQTFRVHAPFNEQLPHPVPGSVLIVMGSPAGVYEPHEWIPALEQSVREYVDAGQRVLGICFGHQLIAQALGGVVEKSNKGWGVGVHTYDMATDIQYANFSLPRFSCAVSHQDQVVALPEGAIRIAGSAFCPNGVISYAEGRGLTFQMHPEFSPAFALELLETKKQIPADVRALAKASFRGGSDRTLVSGWIAAFLSNGEF